MDRRRFMQGATALGLAMGAGGAGPWGALDTSIPICRKEGIPRLLDLYDRRKVKAP